MKRSVSGVVVLLAALAEAQATPVIQHFTPQPRIDAPQHLERADKTVLQRHVEELRARLAGDPGNQTARHALGTALFHLGARDEAAALWTEASAADPNFAPAGVMADIHDAFALMRQGKPDDARRQIELAGRRHRTSAHFQLMRGEQAMRSGNTGAAEAAYRKAFELAPQLYVTSLNLARLFEYRQAHDEARRYYREAARRAPGRAAPWDFLGAHQFRQGDAAALESLRRAEAAETTQPLAEIRLAELSLEIRDLIGARHWYKEALARAKAGKDPVRIALSDVQMRLGLLDEARAQIDDVLSRTVAVPLLVARGYIHERQGEPDEAAKRYRGALAVDPRNVVAGNNLAMLLIRNGKDEAAREALALARAAHETHPGNAAVFATYACALAFAGESKAALDQLSKAVRLTPDDAWTRYFLGKTLAAAGRAGEARLHLEASVVLDRDFPRRAEVARLLAANR